MATEQEIAEHKSALLAAVAEEDWKSANEELGWLSQYLVKNQLIGFYPYLLINLNQAMGENCKTPIAFTMRGYVKNELGDHHGAIEDFDNAIQFESVNSYKARSYFYRGIAYDKLDNIQKSIESLNKAIEFKSDYDNAYYYLGNARRKLNDFETAISNYTETIRLNPKYVDAYNNRGIARFKLGDLQGSLSDLNDAIRLKPDHARSYNNRGNTKSALGDNYGAISDYNDAIRLTPFDGNIYYNRGLTKLELINKNHKEKGKNFKDELERSGAIDDFRDAIRLDQSEDKENKIRQFENIVRFVSYINKNIEFEKEELDKRRIMHEKSVKCFLQMNYGLALILFILLPLFFLIFASLCSIEFEKIEMTFEFLLNYLNKIPTVAYVVLSIALFTPSLFFAIQIYFIHRLEYRTHQSKFPLQELTSNRAPIYTGDDQPIYGISPAEMTKIAAQTIATSS